MMFFYFLVLFAPICSGLMSTPISPGQWATGSLNCKEYAYFEVENAVDCTDLHVHLAALSGNPNLYVSKSPVQFPTVADQTWASVQDQGYEDFVISAWDTAFQEGMFYIGVYAQCSSSEVQTSFNLSVAIEPSPNNVFLEPLVNVPLSPEGYTFHHFCVPSNIIPAGKCLDMNVTLTNDFSLSFPELLVSPHQANPTLHSHSWKFADYVRRYVGIWNDDQDYRLGAFYFSIYGWCTPEGHCGVPDEECESSCSKVHLDRANVTVNTEIVECRPPRPSLGLIPTPLLNATTVRGFAECLNYSYYQIDVTEPCHDLRIVVTALSGEPDLYVGRGSVINPTLNDLTWTSYEWGGEDMTISSSNPEFHLGSFYIGVYGYCGEDIANSTRADFEVTAFVLPNPDSILNSEVHGTLQANDYTYHKFCVPAQDKVTVELHSDDVPDYQPGLIISRTDATPHLQSYGWKLVDGESSIVFDQGIGYYFVSVYGSCSPQGGATACDLVNQTSYTIRAYGSSVHSPPPGKVNGKERSVSWNFWICLICLLASAGVQLL